MADATLQHGAAAGHGAAGEYEAPLFGAYSKKVGMWLFLASDSLTFGALLFAFSYNRIYTAWPTPLGKDSIINATVMTACLLSSSLTMVLGVFAAQRGDRLWTRLWLLATMAFGTAFIVLHGKEWTHLIHEGLTLPGFPKSVDVGAGDYAKISSGVPQFAATFFGLTAMHMLHVTIGVIYLGVVALRKWFLPILGVIFCGYLMAVLPGLTWIRFFVWLVLGLVIYFIYGRWHSRVSATANGAALEREKGIGGAPS